MDNGAKMYLNMKTGLVVAVVGILIGGFAATSGVVQATNNGSLSLQSEFISSAVPFCSSGVVVTISGIAHFTFHESLDTKGGLHQIVHLNYQDVRAVDSSGNVYPVQEAETAVFNQIQPVTVFHSTINGIILGHGTIPNTHVTILMQVVLDQDGVKTEVQRAEVKCNG